MLVLEASGVPVLGWNQLMAFTLRDANLENDRLINQFAKWNLAKSLEEFVGLHSSELGVPWVNTVASGPGKPAYYGDVTVVPHVTDEKIATCAAEPFNTVVGQLSPGLPVLDGSRAACEWGSDPDAPAPGIFGPGNLPKLQRDDYVTNCNDSHWLSNPRQPLTGFDRIIGDENAERTLRTRLCTLQAERRLGGGDGLPGNRFTQDNLKELALGSEIYSATLAKQTVVDALCQVPVLLSSGLMPVQTAEGCAALAAWDGKANLDSKGAHLWREFWSRAIRNPGGLPAGVPPLHFPFDTPVPASLPTNLWANGFNAANPLNTPNTLNVTNPFTSAALADAILAVQASGFALDEPLGNIQKSGVQASATPIFGGTSPEGAFTIVSTQPGRLNAEGYKVTFGNSYIQAVTWDENGTPQADAMLTYSLSTDPANPHFDDYTKAYSQKNWARLPYTRSQIEAQKIGPVLNLRAPKTSN
jgi:acyl-homoserine-lactone acylase